MRALVRESSAGKRVLNLFCYTASFSVCAAVGDAAQVDSVDLSRTYLDWAGINFSLNGYEASVTGTPRTTAASRYTLIRADVLAFLATAEMEKRSWDMIILDPPTFSNSKKMKSTLDIKRDHRALIGRALKLLSPGGQLWFSANARHFHLDGGDFPGIEIKDMEKEITDEDFTGKKLPKCYLLKNRGNVNAEFPYPG
jgi:23S rRNA G2069 N7-methylase RlmK/C1962 C5-methylase RlmI